MRLPERECPKNFRYPHSIRKAFERLEKASLKMARESSSSELDVGRVAKAISFLREKGIPESIIEQHVLTVEYIQSITKTQKEEQSD